MTTGPRILVVDDEPAILRTLSTSLRGHGYQVDTASTAPDAVASYERSRPDLVLLDLGLPGGDGTDVIRRVRERGSTPIIVLSARDGDRDKVGALDLGADDYVSKPFSSVELRARIRAALRRLAGPVGADGVFTAGTLRVDLATREVVVAGDAIRLTPTEYDLLKAFIRHPNRVLTDRTLLHEVWGADYTSEAHYLHVYVARLRKKLERDSTAPRMLLTEPGVGYRLVVPDGADH